MVNLQEEVLKFCQDEAHSISEISQHLRDLGATIKDETLKHMVYGWHQTGYLWKRGTTRAYYLTTDEGKASLNGH